MHESGATDREIESLMRLVHVIEAEHRARPTSALDLRARMLIQELGLNGQTPILHVRRSLRLTPSTLTSLADRLERDGYIERRRHPTDRRTVVLALTPAGQRAYAAEKEFYRHLIDDSLSSLDAESRTHVLSALAGIAKTPQTSQNPGLSERLVVFRRDPASRGDGHCVPTGVRLLRARGRAGCGGGPDDHFLALREDTGPGRSAGPTLPTESLSGRPMTGGNDGAVAGAA